MTDSCCRYVSPISSGLALWGTHFTRKADHGVCMLVCLSAAENIFLSKLHAKVAGLGFGVKPFLVISERVVEGQ